MISATRPTNAEPSSLGNANSCQDRTPRKRETKLGTGAAHPTSHPAASRALAAVRQDRLIPSSMRSALTRTRQQSTDRPRPENPTTTPNTTRSAPPGATAPENHHQAPRSSTAAHPGGPSARRSPDHRTRHRTRCSRLPNAPAQTDTKTRVSIPTGSAPPPTIDHSGQLHRQQRPEPDPIPVQPAHLHRNPLDQPPSIEGIIGARFAHNGSTPPRRQDRSERAYRLFSLAPEHQSRILSRGLRCSVWAAAISPWRGRRLPAGMRLRS